MSRAATAKTVPAADVLSGAAASASALKPILTGSRTLNAVLIAFCLLISADALIHEHPMLGLAAIGLAIFLAAIPLIEDRRAMRSAGASTPALESLADRMWELQESEERFHGLVDALGDLVIHRDREGHIVYANTVFRDLVGKHEKDILGRRLADLGVEVGMVPDAAFQQDECLTSTDVSIQTAVGTRWFSWIELSMRDAASKTVSHRAIARDITSRKRAESLLIGARERAEYASTAKSRFLATVSHEIRTPMNGIMGMTKLLADTGLTAEQRTYVGAVSTSASALLALIDDLLDFSRIEAGRFTPEPLPMSPRELAEGVVELLAARAFGKTIGLACHIAPEVPQSIVADPGRLRQVLLNLIGNAIKFTVTGGVLVSVTVVGKALRFAVSDTGVGLKPEDLERIFEEFEQADGSSTRAHAGAGLGLAISRRIVEALGGKITVTSDPGHGSEFAFEIPLGGSIQTQPVRDHLLQGHRSLIVSNNEVESEAIARTIRAHGGMADIATAVDQAAQLAGIGPYNAVLIDASLEQADGRALKRLHDQGFVGGQPVILIAPTDRGSLSALRTSGYETFLARPVRGETLLRVLSPGPTGAPVPSQASPVRQALRTAHKAEIANLSVLIAEDNEINALLARTCLQKAGHRVEVVGNGKAAVEAFTTPGRGCYDVVLMDLHMPVMDGLEAIALIRRHEEESGMAPTPILVLSADGQEATRHTVLAHGASGMVTKPLDPDRLVQMVEAAGV